MSVTRKYRFTDWPLRRIVSDRIPTWWIFLDTETRIATDPAVESHTFRMGWTCLWKRSAQHDTQDYTWHFWTDCDAISEYLHTTAHRTGKLIILGHNIYFDLQVIGFFSAFTRRGWKLKFLYNSHSAFILKAIRGKDTIFALSTTNWFDERLEDLGPLVGKPKLKVDFTRSSFQELKTYCRRDVEILTLIMRYYLEFISHHHLGKFSLTKASQAFTAYRYRFLQGKIRIHRDETVTELERSAFMGGRCECFFVGQPSGGPFVCLDVNSMYPFVMSRYRYPQSLVDYWENLSPADPGRYLDKFCVVSQVALSTPEPAFAVRQGDKLVFPVGEFDAYLCTEALRYALKKGYVQHIYKLAIYRSADLFSGYVNYFHPVREGYRRDKNKIMDLLCKYMENSLYGKWGQRQPFEIREEYSGEHEYFRDEILDMVTGEMITHTWLMNTHIVRYGSMEANNSFAGIAAHITENARMLLWSIIQSVGLERVLYCDTDSIIMRKEDLKYLSWKVDAYALGALKLQHTWSDLFIGGAKYYVTPDNRHIKGIPSDAVEIAPGVYEFYYWPQITYHLRHGITVGYHRRKIRRVVNLNYDKGIVHPNGRVTPLEFYPQQLPF